MIRNSQKLTPNEFVIGFVYYVLQLIVIPTILVFVNLMLPAPFSDAQVNFAFFAINFLAVLLIFRKFLLSNLRTALAQPRVALRDAAIALGIYFAGTMVITTVITWIDPAFANINDQTLMEMVLDHFGLMIIGTVLLVPIVEETFYRGLIFRSLFGKSPAAAYIVSMVVFSLVHIAGYVMLADWQTLLLCFFQYLPAGFALAWAYHHSGTIFAPILVHMAVNLVGMLAMR